MVECSYDLDTIFQSLSHPTRRDIIRRISEKMMTVSEIADFYGMTLAGVAKHLEVLARANIIRKIKSGKERIIELNPGALALANDYLETYRLLWEERLDSLGSYLETMKNEDNRGDK